MRDALYINKYSDGPAKRAKRAAYLGHDVEWAARLPEAWRAQAIGPLWVKVHRDLEVQSGRWIGYDEDEQPCFCRYCFQRGNGPGDSGYGEDLAAWRMRDGRWLIHRIIMCQANTDTSTGFYGFSERMPR